MFKDDYVLRHIRLLVLAIARVLGLIKDGDLGLALETVRVSFHDTLGMGLDDFLSYPDERVRDYLYFGELEVMGLNRVAFASNLLLQAGLIFKAKGSSERSRACFEKSIVLLLNVHLSESEGDDPELPDFAASIDELLEHAPPPTLKDSTLVPLVFYFDRSGGRRKALQTIRILIDRNQDDPDIQDTARSFYIYLLDEADDVLAESGLKRAEIQTLLEELN